MVSFHEKTAHSRGRLPANAEVAFAHGMTTMPVYEVSGWFDMETPGSRDTASMSNLPRLRYRDAYDRVAPFAAGIRTPAPGTRRAHDHSSPRDLVVDRTGSRARRPQ